METLLLMCTCMSVEAAYRLVHKNKITANDRCQVLQCAGAWMQRLLIDVSIRVNTGDRTWGWQHAGAWLSG